MQSLSGFKARVSIGATDYSVSVFESEERPGTFGFVAIGGSNVWRGNNKTLPYFALAEALDLLSTEAKRIGGVVR